MTSQAQIVLRPVGIVTQPNKLGVYQDGALSKADRAYLRNLATLESAFTWVNKGGSTGGGAASIVYVFTLGQQAMVIYENSGWRMQWLDLVAGTTHDAQLLQDPSSNSYSIATNARLSVGRARSRSLLACQRGVLTWDYENPTSGAQSNPRAAGLAPPRRFVPFQSLTNVQGGGALNNNTHCHVTAVVRRRFTDDYELVSTPFPATQITNISGGFANFQWFAQLPAASVAGDIVQIYRTRSQTYNGATGTNTGSDYFLSDEYVITAADASSTFTPTLTSTTPDDGLGEALYTNDGEGTAAAVAMPPVTSKIIVSFRGHTFYMNRTRPAFFKFRVPVMWGNLPTGAAALGMIRSSGIGSRLASGTATSGSAIITAVTAADMVGVVIGQTVNSQQGTPRFPLTGSLIVVSTTSTTITLSQNATSSGAAGVNLHDMLEIDGLSWDNAFPEQIGELSGSANLIAIMLDRVIPTLAVAAGVGAASVPAEDIVLTRRLMSGTSAQPISVRATNGQNYVPSLPTYSDTARVYNETAASNEIGWSEQNQPENCPPLNTLPCGVGDLYGAISTRDAVMIFASDGLWRLSGTGGTAGSGYDWRIDPVDSTLSLSGPQALCVLRDTVYAYTNRGLVAVDSSGQIRELSQNRINDVLPGPPFSAPTYSASTAMFLIADETNDEIIMREPLAAGGRMWIYNTLTDAFTQDIPATQPVHGDYSTQLQAPVVASLSSGQIVTPTQTTRAQMDATFQPLYADNPFNLRHWQQADVALECSSNEAVTLTLNGSVAAGTRTASPGGDSIHSRTSFSIPRNSPAVANNIAVSLSLASSSVQVKLQGIALKYVDLTDQRKNR